MVNKIPEQTPQILEGMLDYCAAKQKVISKNIANIGTEGYCREEIKFREFFDQSIHPNLKTTNEKHFGFEESDLNLYDYEAVKDKTGEMTSGFNNVDIDKEMADMAENAIRFKFAARKIADYYRTLQRAIKGGGA